MGRLKIQEEFMEGNGKTLQIGFRKVMVFLGSQKATFHSYEYAIEALDRLGVIRENGNARDVLERRSLCLCAESVETWP